MLSDETGLGVLSDRINPKEQNFQALSQTKGFSGGLAGKESACNVEDLGSVPGLGRCPGERIL